MTATTEQQNTSKLDETNPLVQETLKRIEELTNLVNHGEAATAELARRGLLVACIEDGTSFDFYRDEPPVERPTHVDSHPDTLEIRVI